MTLKVFFSSTFRVWDSLQQVKMVFQQTIREHLGDRFDVFGVEQQDIVIITCPDCRGGGRDRIVKGMGWSCFYSFRPEIDSDPKGQEEDL